MIGLIADDLTGACDTGVQFRQAGLRTWVSVRAFTHLSFPQKDQLDVLAINTDSRHDPPELSARKVVVAAEKLLATGASMVYKKIDSALRGNVAVETNSLLNRFVDRVALVAPAYPAQGRTTLAGHQRVHGVRVSESEFAKDALTPVTESHIPTLLSRTGPSGGLSAREILTVALDELRCEDAFFLDIPPGIRCMVFDAVELVDLMRIARFAARDIDRYIFVGTAGLAQAMANVVGPVMSNVLAPAKGTVVAPRLKSMTRTEVSQLADDARPNTRPGLVVNGSIKTISTQQIRLLVGGGADCVEIPVSSLAKAAATVNTGKADTATVDTTADMANADTTADMAIRLADRVLAGLNAGRDVVLTVEPPTSTKWMGETRPNTQGLSRLINAVLGQTIARVLESRPIALSGLVLNGGDTALSVCDALGIDILDLRQELLPGVVCCTAGHKALPLVLKSGGFGETTTLVDLIEKLKQIGHD